MLPGKYCIGILEEDNPLKSYFRLKPLLVEIDGKYQPFDGEQIYPEHGCIRIVPDKNESSHFKARMRRMGRYCVLDLREHCGENDKIRPNKNYHGDETERNAHIVYSDVVREPAADMIFEIADFEEGAWQGEAPGTPRILRAGELKTYLFQPGSEDAPGRAEPDGFSLAEEEIQRFEIAGFPGETLKLAIRLPAYMESVTGAPSPAKPEPAPHREEAKPAVPAAEPEPEKPWITREPEIQREEPRDLSPAQQSLASQTGLNPRRSRSLQEIIEEKWRHSRVDQLGHPIPVYAMGKPVENPVEHAVEALRSAWSNPEIHDELLEALANLRDVTQGFKAHERAVADAARQRELEDMEAERLRALADLDKLRREKAALRNSFKQEIRQEEAEAFREAVERTKAAQAECRRQEELAEEARIGAEMAQDAFAALQDGRFEEKLRDFALTSRAAELLSRPEAVPHTRIEISSDTPDRAEWLRRVRASFAAEGLEIDDVQAANLLVCAALSERIIFSGAAASDKLPAARALAAAIGSFRELRGKPRPVEESVAVIPDANLCPPGHDIFRGVGGCEKRAFAVACDAGHPLSAEALEHSFLVRIEAPAASAPWKPMSRTGEELTPLKPSALKKAMLVPGADLPEALAQKLQKLRSALAVHGVRLSRSTLDMMWHYCAAMLDLAKLSPAEVLDMAFAQKALPCILAEARVECLAALRGMLADMPRSLSLLDAPLPIMI